jgi:hypothetical protein
MRGGRNSRVARRDGARAEKIASMPTWFDLLVVGGGAAGCVLAARMSEDSERVGAGTQFGLSSGRLVLVDQPSEDVSASDAVKVGERFRLGFGFAGVWRSLVEGAVGRCAL